MEQAKTWFLDESQQFWRKAAHFMDITGLKSTVSSSSKIVIERGYCSLVKTEIIYWNTSTSFHICRDIFPGCVTMLLKVWGSYKWINLIWAVTHVNAAITGKKIKVWSTNVFWLQYRLSPCKGRCGAINIIAKGDLYYRAKLIFYTSVSISINKIDEVTWGISSLIKLSIL